MIAILGVLVGAINLVAIGVNHRMLRDIHHNGAKHGPTDADD